MRWFELMEGRSQDLFNRYGGKVMRLDQLPESAKKAIEQLVADGWSANFPDDLLIGYVHIPMEELQHACMTAPDNEFADDYGDWESYHDWYWSHERDEHYTNHLKEMWPVILDDSEGIIDGWHRLHWYYRNGIKLVPAIHFIQHPEEDFTAKLV